MKTIRSAFLIALALSAALMAFGQDDERVLNAASDYVSSRAAAHNEILITAADAAKLVQSQAKRRILDFRPAADYQKFHLKAAERRTFQQLFTVDGLSRIPKDELILVLGPTSETSIEAVVLLRLLGRKASTVEGGVEALVREIGGRNSPVADTGKDLVEGSDAKKALIPSPHAEPSATQPPDRLEQSVPVWAYGVIAVLILLAASMAVWFGILQPRRKSRPLLEAIKLLAGGGDAGLSKAEQFLKQAVNAGLKPQQQMEAQFLLAYVKARLTRYEDALVILRDSTDTSREALYLRLWLTIREKKWDEAERICYEHFGTLKGYLQSNELAGIAYLELSRQALALKQYDRALTYFEKVRDLGVYKEYVPEHLADLELVLAINDLFEGKTNVGEASRRFEAARKSAEASKRSTLMPRIGSLLCEWKSADVPAIDQKLNDLLDEVRATASREGEKSEAAAVLPAITLWYAVSLLYEWFRRIPKERGLPRDERQKLERRLEIVRGAMPSDGDPCLIAGLLDYYCEVDENRRVAAVDLLRKAIELGVTLPEIIYIVQCEDRLAEQLRHRFDSYLALLRGYLADPSVSIDLRKELLEHFGKFERFKSLGDISLDGDAALAPSLHDVQASCALIEQRMQRIFRGFDEKQRNTVESLLGGLRQSREELQRTVGELGKTEQKLMRVAGETLLPEDTQAAEVS